MNDPRTLQMSFSGPDAGAVFRCVSALPLLPADLPHEVTVDGSHKLTVSPQWVTDALDAAREPLILARWRGPVDKYGGPTLRLFATGTTVLEIPQRQPTKQDADTVVGGVPAHLVVCRRSHKWSPDRRPLVGFGDNHDVHGWAVLLIGPGHERMVSRRWLELGPWLLHRGEDATYAQFHDLAADADGAWSDAFRAHERMGISDGGGFMHPEHQIRTRIKGLYKSTDRSLTIARPNGRSMSQLEMLDLCVYRSRMRADANEPIERIRVVFIEERDARRHLHELWLRELECWCFDADGREVRLDEAYQPERIVPEWVEGAEGLEPRARPVGLRMSLGLGNLLGDTELPEPWCRDDLLFNILDHHTPAPNYAIYEVLNANVPRVSASKGENGDLVVEAAPGVGGALPAEKSAPLLAAARAVVSDVGIWLPPERLGLTLPAIIVPEPYGDQRPFRLEPGHPLTGVVIHGVGDVLARVRSLNREDLREAEALLQLCADHRFVLSARAGEARQE